MTFRRALVLLVVIVLAASLVPTGILLQQRLGDALIERTRDDLALAPRVLADRMDANGTVRMMHARDLAVNPALVSAMISGNLDEAMRVAGEVARAVGEEPILVGEAGEVITGPGRVPEDLVEATRRGEMPVSVVATEGALHIVALAPVEGSGSWVGAAGGSSPFGTSEAGSLAGLTRSDVFILSEDGSLAGASMGAEEADSIARALAVTPRDNAEEPIEDGDVRTVQALGRTFLTASGGLAQGQVFFVRDVDEELSVLPTLRATAIATSAASLLLALLVGVAFADRLSRPISELALATEGFSAGRPDTPLRSSRIKEVQQLSDAFVSMRSALAQRLTDLRDRQERLSALQAELVQRERMAATGRLIAQLAHEIRNPVASVRNCLELVRRKGHLEGEAREFADMAVEELLRMHELSERMLDLHRPRDPDATECLVSEVAEQTAQLLRAGAPEGSGLVSIVVEDEQRVAIGGDALKQVLLNLVMNAREASPNGSPVEIVVSRKDGRIRVEVLDRGPGLSQEVLPRLFDPFFTTKSDVQGVGLGLYTAEVLVRTAGGSLTASNREDGPGARFTVEIPVRAAG